MFAHELVVYSVKNLQHAHLSGHSSLTPIHLCIHWMTFENVSTKTHTLQLKVKFCTMIVYLRLLDYAIEIRLLWSIVLVTVYRVLRGGKLVTKVKVVTKVKGLDLFGVFTNPLILSFKQRIYAHHFILCITENNNKIKSKHIVVLFLSWASF